MVQRRQRKERKRGRVCAGRKRRERERRKGMNKK
jgi:hypothetical protein